MNKEQKKPQEECSYVTTTKHRGNPCKKEEKLQSQEDWEEEFDVRWPSPHQMPDGLTDWQPKNISEDMKNWIQDNFIAKRDLRKLLAEYRNKNKSSYGVTEEGKRYYRGLEWAEGYNSALDDILAEIEKL
jgi:hypothetical protein